MQLRTGNLFDTQCKIIAHGVNCRGAFGSGVAGQIARLFPFVREAYLLKHNSEGWCLGDTQIVYNESFSDKYFINCATQFNYGRGGTHINYAALGVCLNSVFAFAEEANEGVAIPRIGCGLAGGDWSMVSSIIQQCLQEKKIYLEVWSL